MRKRTNRRDAKGRVDDQGIFTAEDFREAPHVNVTQRIADSPVVKMLQQMGIEVHVIAVEPEYLVVTRDDLVTILVNAVLSSHEATARTGFVPDESDCVSFVNNAVDISIADGVLSLVEIERRPPSSHRRN